MDEAGRWTYGPVLDEAAVGDELLEGLLDAAEAAQAAVLVLPEYACTPHLRQRWKAVLRSRRVGTVRWILVGSGPTTVPNENVATLLSATGTTVVDQPKTQLYDLVPEALAAWRCPDLPEEANASALHERATPHRQWAIVETGRARIAIAVCESFKAQVADTAVAPLGRARPTLLLCPVFSQPTDRSHSWERPSSEPWGDRGTAVVIANSLVVAEWQASAASKKLATKVACGAARPLDSSSRGHSWKALYVEPSLRGGVTDSVASVAAAVAGCR
jgi:predicted amidohydrolase